MENTFNLKIISVEKEFYDGPAISLILPACDGSLQILAHHENMVVANTEGIARFKTDEGSEELQAVVGVGFVSIINNTVTMLVTSVEYPSDVEEARAREAAERAKEVLRQDASLQEYNQSRAALARAMQRLANPRVGIHED